MPAAAIDPQEQTLPNGLRAVIIEVPHLHTVSLVMYARVGSRYESVETNGLSHFVEHMLFRGTAAHPDSPAPFASGVAEMETFPITMLKPVAPMPMPMLTSVVSWST